MSFGSLEKILAAIAQRSEWQQQQIFQTLLEIWPSVVSPSARLNSRPLFISREILTVGTSSSVWAQQLFLQRLSVLKKLNSYFLQPPLKDIRFHSVHKESDNLAVTAKSSSSSLHPSYLKLPINESELKDLPNPKDLQSSFSRWVNLRSLRTENLPLCRLCQAPTPPGEIERWTVCACCSHKLSF